ncbi:MAG: ABC transporter ATP-binding protein [Anaerolineae bacterium]|nr:ABC transporter ATP-binding protein [Anaerolineae bacterium]
MTAIVEIKDLCKSYRKNKPNAVDHLSLEIEKGAIYAFIGPNGAGKTTTIRILTTLLKLDSGEVRISGYRVDTHPRDVRRVLGYIPDEFGLYGEMLVHEYLEFFAGCYHIPSEQRAKIANDLLELVGLAHRREDEVHGLSRGMRQRLGLARALVHDPSVIIADEPAAGLDPRARVELREIFRVLQDMGKTIFLSSHVLRELDDVATHMGIIEEGKLVASGPVGSIRGRLRPHRRVRVSFLGPSDDAQVWLAAQPDILNVEVANGNGSEKAPTLLITLAGDTEEAVVQLLAQIVGAGFAVLGYKEEHDTLESMFLNLTQGIVS